MAAGTKIKTSPSKASRNWGLTQVLPWLLLICGLVALAAAFMLSVERISSLQNPHFRPVCNLNPIFSCSSVSASNQAHVFGFYNPFLGIAGYAAVATIGAAWLAGARFKRWFWLLMEAGLLFAVGFTHWLIYSTLYSIGALCIFCMITWAMVIPMFWYTTLYVGGLGYRRLSRWQQTVVTFGRRHHADILLLWYLIIIALIAQRFWYYWSTL